MYELVIKGLKQELEEYANFIKRMVADCITAMLDKDVDILRNIIEEREPVADEKENKIEKHCIEIIARFKPMAQDLREVIMIMKMSDDLERIGDHIENICESAIFLAENDDIKPLIDIPRMGEIVQKMIQMSITAFMRESPETARKVLDQDEIIDNLNKQVFKVLLKMMVTDSDVIPVAVQLIRVAHNFERIGDLATNLCEDIIYIEEGNMIRHKLGKFEV